MQAKEMCQARIVLCQNEALPTIWRMHQWSRISSRGRIADLDRYISLGGLIYHISTRDDALANHVLEKI